MYNILYGSFDRDLAKWDLLNLYSWLWFLLEVSVVSPFWILIYSVKTLMTKPMVCFFVKSCINANVLLQYALEGM